MSSCFGNYFRLSLFGQSHGPAVGVTLDGFPAGMEIDMEDVLHQMARRAPGQSALTTPRKESDAPEIISGYFRGKTTGQPLTCPVAGLRGAGRSAPARSRGLYRSCALLRL